MPVCTLQYTVLAYAGGQVGQDEVQLVCKIDCAVQYSVHGEVPSCDEA